MRQLLALLLLSPLFDNSLCFGDSFALTPPPAQHLAATPAPPLQPFDLSVIRAAEMYMSPVCELHERRLRDEKWDEVGTAASRPTPAVALTALPLDALHQRRLTRRLESISPTAFARSRCAYLTKSSRTIRRWSTSLRHSRRVSSTSSASRGRAGSTSRRACSGAESRWCRALHTL